MTSVLKESRDLKSALETQVKLGESKTACKLHDLFDNSKTPVIFSPLFSIRRIANFKALSYSRQTSVKILRSIDCQHFSSTVLFESRYRGAESNGDLCR